MDYNPAGEIVTRHPNSVTKDTYTYNNDGDRISETDAAAPTTPLTYDANDRLTSYNSAATYTYNGDGLRTSKTIAAVTTRFSYDLTTPAPQLLADNTGYYIYGPNGEVVEQLDHNAAALYLHQDQLGSTRLITGATGESVGSLTYTPYGTPTGAATSAASTLTPIGFAGAYTDTETGYLYLTNRYYDPTTGQFLTRDPLQATTAQPYQYANDDPLDFTDPSGLCWGPAWACTAASAAGGAIGGAASWTNQNVVQPIYHDVVLPVYHHSGDIATGLAVGACLTASLADAETTGGVCIAGGIAAFGARVNQRRMESGWCGSWQEDLADLVLAAGTLGIGGAAESALAEWAPETPLYELVKTGLKIRLAVPEVLIEVIDHLGH